MKYEITEKQIKELAKGNAKVKTMFPEVFETKLEVGKWYKSDYPLLIYIEEIHHHTLVGYGFNSNYDFSETKNFCTRANENDKVDYEEFNFRLATDSEVLEALTNEAKKRGLVKNTFIISCFSGTMFKTFNDSQYYIDEQGDFRLGSVVIFYKGKWAEIIKTYTKEEAEKLLNAKII